MMGKVQYGIMHSATRIIGKRYKWGCIVTTNYSASTSCNKLSYIRQQQFCAAGLSPNVLPLRYTFITCMHGATCILYPRVSIERLVETEDAFHAENVTRGRPVLPHCGCRSNTSTRTVLQTI